MEASGLSEEGGRLDDLRTVPRDEFQKSGDASEAKRGRERGGGRGEVPGRRRNLLPFPHTRKKVRRGRGKTRIVF